jgi:HPt (histidine-containing phosphotransfer) domain-containing protein
MNSMQESDDSQNRGGDSGIDLQAALAMAGGDVALLRDLAGAFLDEVPRLVGHLRRALEEHDSAALRSAAHQLQGVMRCLHIERALHQSQTLEQHAEGTTDWPAVEKLLAELDQTLEVAVGALKKFLNEPS